MGRRRPLGETGSRRICFGCRRQGTATGTELTVIYSASYSCHRRQDCQGLISVLFGPLHNTVHRLQQKRKENLPTRCVLRLLHAIAFKGSTYSLGVL